jgi:transcriptional regulator with XRE-family HTH domain
MKNKNTKKEKIERKNDFRFEVANLITEARFHYKLTQADLAKRMKTKQPSIARVESGGILPSLSFLEKLAESLNTYLIAPKFGFMEDSVLNITINMKIETTPSLTEKILTTKNNTDQNTSVVSGYFGLKKNQELKEKI